MAKWVIFEQKLPGRMPNAHNNRSDSRPKKDQLRYLKNLSGMTSRKEKNVKKLLQNSL